MNEWINFKNQIPPISIPILVWGVREHENEPDMYIAQYLKVQTIDGIDCQFWESPTAYDIYNVTHWTFLPNPPTNLLPIDTDSVGGEE